eukprot:m.84768 g.84768  ORF g.84768 m.84768 type:complete len:366 (-) comp14699_c0_seq2:69-1166(-)
MVCDSTPKFLASISCKTLLVTFCVTAVQGHWRLSHAKAQPPHPPKQGRSSPDFLQSQQHVGLHQLGRYNDSRLHCEIGHDGCQGHRQAATLSSHSRCIAITIVSTCQPLSHLSQVCPDYDPSLRSTPWWDDRSDLPFIPELEAGLGDMREELRRYLHNGKTEFNLESDFGLIASGEWTEYILWQDGKYNAEHCTYFPKTCSHISKALLVTGWLRYSENYELGGQVTILKMSPGTHLRVHTGGTNRRLTVQLPLVVPDGIKFRVANETRGYALDSALVFDDCYEHEVRHLGSTDRYVLYMTARHPDLGLDLHRPTKYNQELLEIAQQAVERGLLKESEKRDMEESFAHMELDGAIPLPERHEHDEL